MAEAITNPLTRQPARQPRPRPTSSIYTTASTAPSISSFDLNASPGPKRHDHVPNPTSNSHASKTSPTGIDYRNSAHSQARSLSLSDLAVEPAPQRAMIVRSAVTLSDLMDLCGRLQTLERYTVDLKQRFEALEKDVGVLEQRMAEADQERARGEWEARERLTEVDVKEGRERDVEERRERDVEERRERDVEEGRARDVE